MDADDKKKILLETYYDEWKFRNEGLWKRIIQFFVIIFFVSTFPISVRVFERLDGVDLSIISSWIFPVMGTVLSICLFIFCLVEGAKMLLVALEIKKIKAEFGGEEADRSQHPYTQKLAKWRPSILVPGVLCILLIGLAWLVFYYNLT